MVNIISTWCIIALSIKLWILTKNVVPGIGGLFRPFKAYFHKSVPETYRYSFQFYGGQVEEQFDEFLNNFSYYFVTEDIEENDLKTIKTARRNDVREKKAFRILNYDWISNCLQEKRLVDENDYIS